MSCKAPAPQPPPENKLSVASLKSIPLSIGRSLGSLTRQPSGWLFAGEWENKVQQKVRKSKVPTAGCFSFSTYPLNKTLGFAWEAERGPGTKKFAKTATKFSRGLNEPPPPVGPWARNNGPRLLTKIPGPQTKLAFTNHNIGLRKTC